MKLKKLVESSQLHRFLLLAPFGAVSKHEKTLNRKVRKECAEFAKD